MMLVTARIGMGASLISMGHRLEMGDGRFLFPPDGVSDGIGDRGPGPTPPDSVVCVFQQDTGQITLQNFINYFGILAEQTRWTAISMP
jgi:hypothetical protein